VIKGGGEKKDRSLCSRLLLEGRRLSKEKKNCSKSGKKRTGPVNREGGPASRTRPRGKKKKGKRRRHGKKTRDCQDRLRKFENRRRSTKGSPRREVSRGPCLSGGELQEGSREEHFAPPGRGGAAARTKDRGGKRKSGDQKEKTTAWKGGLRRPEKSGANGEREGRKRAVGGRGRGSARTGGEAGLPCLEKRTTQKYD